jgi:hypothetical protein
MDNLVQDMANNGNRGGQLAVVLEPKDVELFKELANRLNHDDILLGSSRWLENFREMKQAAIDLLYKDCPKQWTALHFNL